MYGRFQMSKRRKASQRSRFTFQDAKSMEMRKSSAKKMLPDLTHSHSHSPWHSRLKTARPNTSASTQTRRRPHPEICPHTEYPPDHHLVHMPSDLASFFPVKGPPPPTPPLPPPSSTNSGVHFHGCRPRLQHPVILAVAVACDPHTRLVSLGLRAPALCREGADHCRHHDRDGPPADLG